MEERRLEKLAGYATTMAHSWIDARQKVAIFRGLQSEELRRRLSPSHGAIAYNVLAKTLLFDLIRDVWAFTLDTDQRAPSIAGLWRALESPEVRAALRERFDDSQALEDWLPTSIPEVERSQLLITARVDRRTSAFAAFDQVFEVLERTVPAVLASERAARISKARKRAIAHFNVTVASGEYAVFDPSTIDLDWEDPANFLDETRDIILHIAGVVGRVSFDLAEFERLQKCAADDFWSRILGTGPVELGRSINQGRRI